MGSEEAVDTVEDQKARGARNKHGLCQCRERFCFTMPKRMFMVSGL